MADGAKKAVSAARAALAVAFFACLALAAAYFTQGKPAADVPEPVALPEARGPEVPKVASLGTTVEFLIGSAVTFDDGLVVALDAIDDSRCPKDVQCVWAGELSQSLRVRGGRAGETENVLHLGTVTASTKSAYGYAFAVVAADERSLMLRVALDERP